MMLNLPDNVNPRSQIQGNRSGSHGRAFVNNIGPPVMHVPSTIGGLEVNTNQAKISRGGIHSRSPGVKIKQSHIDIAKKMIQQENQNGKM